MYSFAKLKNGEWGVRAATSRPVAGTVVAVAKRDGTTSTVTLGARIAGGADWALYAVQSSNGSASAAASRTSRPRGRRTGCSCGSREDESRDSDCAQCRFDQDDC